MSDIIRKFKDGDVVRLKSGGPKMTIAWLDLQLNPETAEFDLYSGQVLCEWFDEKEIKYQKFRQDSLELDEK